ncbi:hypothetical protein PPACK8108_LOCUS20041 [Phakopsora pachyrhizi]|uniref:Uncharacterized protein n=1 Tax=Phakopsora pachyrhizi TaxID=170000 RepID=A0AAV0BEA5_PHAPC|nr:hypothetical protein PPACK8108_LOCUS20041 [Phakopsora pachyrhizi]
MEIEYIVEVKEDQAGSEKRKPEHLRSSQESDPMGQNGHNEATWEANWLEQLCQEKVREMWQNISWVVNPCFDDSPSQTVLIREECKGVGEAKLVGNNLLDEALNSFIQKWN